MKEWFLKTLGLIKPMYCDGCGFSGFINGAALSCGFRCLSCMTPHGRTTTVWVCGETKKYYLVEKSNMQMFNNTLEQLRGE